MDSPGRDIVSCLLRFIKFQEAKLLAQTNRFWQLQLRSETWWELWFGQEFGRQPHPPTPHYSPCVAYPERPWFERFQKFWLGRKRGRAAIKLPERFESSFYYRRLDKPCVFVENYIDGIIPLTGDIILDASAINQPKLEYPHWGITFYDSARGRCIHDFSLRQQGSVPRNLWFPKIPFDYYWKLMLPCVVHISMPTDYRDKLKFELDTEGKISQYTDPRFPGNFIHIQHGVDHPTIQEFGRLIVNNTLHAELWGVADSHFFLAAIETPN
jgi:hypothetical protein